MTTCDNDVIRLRPDKPVPGYTLCPPSQHRAAVRAANLPAMVEAVRAFQAAVDAAWQEDTTNGGPANAGE